MTTATKTAAPTIRKSCGKCNGAGFLSAFRHVSAGRCFSCHGVGYFELSAKPAAIKARARSAAKREAKRAAQRAHAAEMQAARDTLAEQYRNDDRLGPDTRARFDKHPAFQFEVVGILTKWDADPAYIQERPWIARNLAE
jgi:hypothetical protein